MKQPMAFRAVARFDLRLAPRASAPANAAAFQATYKDLVSVRAEGTGPPTIRR